MSCVVKIFGVGGGDTFKLKYEAKDTLEVHEVCGAFIYSFPAVWEYCEIHDAHGLPTRFVRLKEVLSDCEKLLVKNLTPEPCLDPKLNPQSAEELCEIDLRDQRGVTVKKSLKVLAEVKFKGDAKVELPTFGVEVGTAFEAERSYETELEYVLPGGRQYIAFRPANRGTWLWRTNPA
jgi:hypothetical protein